MHVSYQDNPTGLMGEVFKMAKLMQNAELYYKKINITKWLVTWKEQLNNGSEQKTSDKTEAPLISPCIYSDSPQERKQPTTSHWETLEMIS